MSSKWGDLYSLRRTNLVVLCLLKIRTSRRKRLCGQLEFVSKQHNLRSLGCCVCEWLTASILCSVFSSTLLKKQQRVAYEQAIHYRFPCENRNHCAHFSFSCHTFFSQQQRKEREMVRQQEKGPHRRLDDMRREEDRRLAEREQVTNHRRRGAAISQSLWDVGVFITNTASCSGGEIPWVGCHSSKGLN